ncbi:hypothetical protein BH11PSE2_BH11PSE2_21590 [soil metagenome]
MTWRDVHVGFEGDDFKVEGRAVWKDKWRPIDTEKLQLPHPAYRHELHSYWVYEIGEADRPIRFAAGELSNGVWGFYVPA